MDLRNGTLHTIRWNELCPWLLLIKATRAALFGRVLLLALTGVWLTHAGWIAFDSLASESSQLGLAPMATVSDRTVAMPYSASVRADCMISCTGTGSVPSPGPLVYGWGWAMQPFAKLCEVRTLGSALFACLAGLWTLAVWALCGGAISRIAALWLTRGESLGLTAAIKESLRAWPATIGAPVVSLVGLAFLALPLLLAGLLLRFGAGEALVAIAWVLVLVAGLVFLIAALGLLLGWPLMWSTVAVERTDAFDGVSRAYAYVFQRPLHLLFYLAVATGLGWLAQVLMNFAAESTVSLTTELVSTSAGQAISMTQDWPIARFWQRCLLNIAAAFPMAFLWPACVAIYLLLRQQIDATELDEVAFDEAPTAGPRALKQNRETGVPEMPESPETSDTKSEPDK